METHVRCATYAGTLFTEHGGACFVHTLPPSEECRPMCFPNRLRGLLDRFQHHGMPRAKYERTGRAVNRKPRRLHSKIRQYYLFCFLLSCHTHTSVRMYAPIMAHLHSVHPRLSIDNAPPGHAPSRPPIPLLAAFLPDETLIFASGKSSPASAAKATHAGTTTAPVDSPRHPARAHAHPLIRDAQPAPLPFSASHAYLYPYPSRVSPARVLELPP